MKYKDNITAVHGELNLAHQALVYAGHVLRQELDASQGKPIKSANLRKAITELRTASTYLTRTGSAFNSAVYYSNDGDDSALRAKLGFPPRRFEP